MIWYFPFSLIFFQLFVQFITIWGNFLLLLTTEIRFFVAKIRNIRPVKEKHLLFILFGCYFLQNNKKHLIAKMSTKCNFTPLNVLSNPPLLKYGKPVTVQPSQILYANFNSAHYLFELYIVKK